MLASGTAAAERLIGEFRDPFQVSHTPSPPSDVSKSQPVPPADRPIRSAGRSRSGNDARCHVFPGPRPDRDHRRPDLLQGSTSSIQERLPKNPPRRLVLTVVLPSKVILRGNNRNYVLSYPDQLGKRPAAPSPGPDCRVSAMATMLDPAGQLAMFQKLLNSPLGALGKSIIGKSALTDSLSGNTPGRGAAVPLVTRRLRDNPVRRSLTRPRRRPGTIPDSSTECSEPHHFEF